MICTPLLRVLVSETVLQYFHNLLALTYFKNSATSVLGQYLSDLPLLSQVSRCKFDYIYLTNIQNISVQFKEKKNISNFYLKSTEDARITHTFVLCDLTKTASKNVQMPENLKHKKGYSQLIYKIKYCMKL